jgi:TfoX N-terminal domain
MADRPSFDKSPAPLVARFATVLERVATPATARRKMFGYPAAFVGGNLATGLFGGGWFVRLAPDELTAALESGAVQPFEPMAGRPMRGYAMLGPAIVDDDAALDAWVGRALAFTGTLPTK